MIEAAELSRSYGPVLAVNGVTFKVDQGEIVGFLGPNGAGKTTTMRMLAGLLRAGSGRASIAGHDVVSAGSQARAHLGYMPEAASGFGDLTVAEFLLFCANARGLTGRLASDALDSVSEQVDLAPAMNRRMNSLSKGWRQRAWFAQAVLHRPPALILDEPTDGLDPNQKNTVRDFIRRISPDTAILFSTHILEEAEQLCDRILILSSGRLAADAPLHHLADESGRLLDRFTELTSVNDGIA